jgi:hypothetical protein
MQFRVACFEIKRLGEDIWQEVPEKKFMEKLTDCVDPVTPAITKMLQGGEIVSLKEIYRIRC